MPKRGKRFREAAAKLDSQSRYSVTEAVGLVKEVAPARFDESFDVAIKLDVHVDNSNLAVQL